jgi:NADH-quinone oxidoreductase subunit H
MFFLGEYSNMLLMSTIMGLLFFGGWTLPDFVPIIFSNKYILLLVMVTKVILFSFLFILVRATFPRYRYDQLMDIGWKIFLPISLGYLFFVAALLLAFNATPVVLEVFPALYNENFIDNFVIGLLD